ncbi:hypothetical protein LZ32DRAFT_600892 [Colletotrichum eremochloae]|nr:hypothetical protein LZ32DRAFT_600892 [Colletotrichum eremochloae]
MIPPWRDGIVSLSSHSPRILASLPLPTHVIGYGPTSVPFHGSLFETVGMPMSTKQLESPIVAPLLQTLPPPFHATQRLSIVWCFVLGPSPDVLVPGFFAKWLGAKT